MVAADKIPVPPFRKSGARTFRESARFAKREISASFAYLGSSIVSAGGKSSLAPELEPRRLEPFIHSFRPRCTQDIKALGVDA